jgi:hypothetical protein
MPANRGNLRERRTQSPIGSQPDLLIHLLLQLVDGLGVENAIAQQPHLEFRQRVALGIRLQLSRRTIGTLVIGKRMRVRPDDVSMHKCRPVAGTAPGNCLFKCQVACDWIGSIDLGEVEVGKVRHQTGDVAAGGVHLDWDGDGIAIVFNDEEDRQFGVRCRIQRLPELSLAGCAFAKGDVDHLVPVKSDMFELTVICLSDQRRIRMAGKIPPRFGATDRLQALRGR